jgi:hypothetical protein
MKKIQTLRCVVTLFFVILSLSVNGSNPLAAGDDSTKNVSFSFNADLVSRYVWRGLPLNLNPNIQPYATLNYKNFSLGAWGSYGLSNAYAEVDLNLSYTLNAFTLSVCDYFNEDETDMSKTNYFKFTDSNTSNTLHSFEGTIKYNGTESFPISLTLATFFYGNDKNEDNKNNYSTYLELGHKRTWGDTEFSFFLGGTVAKGYYAQEAAIVNVGFMALRNMKLSETTSIPVCTSLILNPSAKDIFFVFCITL